METKKTWEDYIPKYVTLTYVDYNSNLDNRTEIQQQCIQDNSYDPLYELVDDIFIDQQCENMRGLLDEIEDAMCDDGIGYEFAENEDLIKDALCSKDDSDPIKDLIRNTNKEIMFYSLGVELPELEFWNTDKYGKMVKKGVKAIKSILKIKSDKYDTKLEIMVEQASYGGELRVYFNERFDTFITDGKENEDEFQSIKFSGNVHIAIANSHNGSGDCTKLPIELELPFKRENLFIDREVKYSFAHDVCGMAEDYADDTKVGLGFLPVEKTKELKPSEMNEHMKEEREYERVFRAGKCTFGDMNITRHRDVEYNNNYPCGHKCPHCRTFWID